MVAQAEESEENLIDGGKMMSLTDHLGELRTRIVRALLAVIILFCVILGFADPFIDFLKQPLMNALPEGNKALHFTGPLDVFVASIKVAILGAVVGAAPFWLYQFWKFFEPALYPKERKYILPFVVVSAGLFLAGVSFAFFVILPEALNWLINYGIEIGTPIITIKDYLSLLMIIIFSFGIVFETPVLLVLLAMLDLVSAEALAEHRRLVLVGILILGAMLTPPDPITQISMAVPVYIMFELSIVIIRLIKGDRGKPKETSG